jgi:hypothetical protein
LVLTIFYMANTPPFRTHLPARTNYKHF